MSNARPLRVVAVAISTALVLGAFVAAPAEAKKKSCPVFNAVEPLNSTSRQTAEALEAKVVKVTDTATADKPIVIEYEHDPGLWFFLTATPIVEDTDYFNFQVETKKSSARLHLEMSWSTPSASDIDMFLHDSAGEEVASSAAFNVAPVEGTFLAGSGKGKGGMGFEKISGVRATDCAGYTVESQNSMTAGEAVTLTVFLGKASATFPRPEEESS